MNKFIKLISYLFFINFWVSDITVIANNSQAVINPVADQKKTRFLEEKLFEALYKYEYERLRRILSRMIKEKRIDLSLEKMILLEAQRNLIDSTNKKILFGYKLFTAGFAALCGTILAVHLTLNFNNLTSDETLLFSSAIIILIILYIDSASSCAQKWASHRIARIIKEKLNQIKNKQLQVDA